MDTTGHTALSAIGEKLLKPALEKSNANKPLRIGAFYFGNWLTDVSQCIDPIAYRNAAKALQEVDESVQQLFDKWRFDAPSWIPFIADDIQKQLDALRNGLRKAEKQLVDDIKTTLEAGSSGDLA